MDLMTTEQFQDALPWFVNGTIAPQENGRVQEMLRGNEEAQQSLAFVRTISRAVNLSPTFDEQSSLENGPPG